MTLRGSGPSDHRLLNHDDSADAEADAYLKKRAGVEWSDQHHRTINIGQKPKGKGHADRIQEEVQSLVASDAGEEDLVIK